MIDQSEAPAAAAERARDVAAAVRAGAPYALAFGVLIAAVAQPSLSDTAKTVITLVLGAALAAIDPNNSRKPGS